MEQMVELAKEKGIELWSPAPGVPTEVVKQQGTVSDWWRAKA
jgi:hypothetical protein